MMVWISMYEGWPSQVDLASITACMYCGAVRLHFVLRRSSPPSSMLVDSSLSDASLSLFVRFLPAGVYSELPNSLTGIQSARQAGVGEEERRPG
jgi:hypothetical protein